MRYCIYAGEIYKIVDDSGKLLSLSGMYENKMVLQEQILEIPEELYLQVKNEYERSVNDLRSCEQRSWRLNSEYYKKHSALQNMRTDAGRREKGVISKLLSEMQVRSDVNARKMD